MNDAYPLPPFRIHERETLCAVMRAYPLANLVTGPAGGAKQSLIPLLAAAESDGSISLLGHLDRNNEQAAALDVGAPLSFQFLGPNSYASPDLYPDPQLPGWLYVSVQGDGTVSEILDEARLRALLEESTPAFGGAGQAFALDPADPRIGRFLPGIKGFRIAVTRISGIAKLAQDKGPANAEIAKDFLADRDNGRSRALFERLLRESL